LICTVFTLCTDKTSGAWSIWAYATLFFVPLLLFGVYLASDLNKIIAFIIALFSDIAFFAIPILGGKVLLAINTDIEQKMWFFAMIDIKIIIAFIFLIVYLVDFFTKRKKHKLLTQEDNTTQ
jgi:glucan phosphoethanolaminetransferase (alkaline phosphatase superfamily)